MSRMLFVSARLFLVLGMLTLIVSCGGDGMQDLRQFVKQTEARKPGRIEPLPELRQVETFVYMPGDRRNPFLPTEIGEPDDTSVGQVDGGPAPPPNHRKQELEQFPLDSIRMVGTVDMSETIWGLVKTSDKTIYRVKVGDYMGQNYGQITSITEDKIELTEIIPKKPRGYMERQASVSLSE